VIDSLSLKLAAVSSRMSVAGGAQVAPWSVDLDTRMADVARSPESDSDIW
jgi:hypothetical protein